jgi:DNA-binding response OmpR family regulator
MNALVRHILLVEDEPGLVLTLTDRLRREGFEVTAASDGYVAANVG